MRESAKWLAAVRRRCAAIEEEYDANEECDEACRGCHLTAGGVGRLHGWAVGPFAQRALDCTDTASGPRDAASEGVGPSRH